MFTKKAAYRSSYAILYFCGSTIIQGRKWKVFLIATPDNIIFDIAIFPSSAVRMTKKKLVITGEQKEVFKKI